METLQRFMSERGIIFHFFIYGIAISYGYNILVNLFQLFQIWKGISRLKRFIIGTHKPFYELKRKMLLSYFPIISRYLGAYSDNLTYRDNDYRLREKAITMYTSMLSIRDHQIHELRGSFNPILGIKTFAAFPMVVLSWFGIRPKRRHKPNINIIGITIEVLLAKVLESHYAELESLVKSIWTLIRGI